MMFDLLMAHANQTPPPPKSAAAMKRTRFIDNRWAADSDGVNRNPAGYDGTAKCGTCRKTKPVSEFYTQGNGSPFRACKECKKNARRQRK